MADAPAAATASGTDASAATATTQPVGYALVGSYSTVQVLSATQVVDVVYCTIKTQPSGVIASLPVQQKIFEEGTSGTELNNFTQAIEQVMSNPHVIAGVGSQSIDASGLLADSVVFTVEYRDPVKAPNGATALATVGVGQLDFSDALIGRTLLAGVSAIIDGVYANLKAAAGG